MNSITYFVYDYDISKYWLLEVDINYLNIRWNPLIYVPERYKIIYIKNHLTKIIQTAKKY